MKIILETMPISALKKVVGSNRTAYCPSCVFWTEKEGCNTDSEEMMEEFPCYLSEYPPSTSNQWIWIKSDNKIKEESEENAKI